jgi:F-type H+-transporting ATPase subunit b
MASLISQLGIEWKVLIAQVINFGILFSVLTYFLYRPILKMLDKRRQDIAKDKENRELLLEKIEGLETMKEDLLKKGRQESDNILKNAEKAAQRIKETAVKDTEKEVEKMHREMKLKMAEEKSNLMRDVKREIGGLVSSAIEKSLGDVLDEKAEEKLSNQAMLKIKNG